MEQLDRTGKASWILTMAARLVPADRRAGWLEAWTAELDLWANRESKLGRPPSTARVLLRSLGSVPHAAWEGARGIDRSVSDVRHAARRLGRTPGFTFVAVLTLALGIGATTAIMSVVYGVLIKPLPYDAPDELVVVWHASEGLGYDRIRMSQAMFFTIRDEQRSFEAFGVWMPGAVTATGAGSPERATAIHVTDGALVALRISPAIGRTFQVTDMDPGGPFTVLLSHGYWLRRYGGDPGAVGQTLTLQGVPAEIIGVLPDGFRFLDRDAELFLPLRIDPEATLLSFDYNGVGRLADGVELEAATADLARMPPISVDRYEWTTPERLAEFGLAPNIRPLREQVVGAAGDRLWVLLGAVGLVLLLACVNVANLLLVRAESRSLEVAVRKALGAPRSRITRHFVSESVLLGLAGGLAGTALAVGGLELLLRFAPPSLPRTSGITLDARILLITLAISVGVGVMFGYLPSLGRGVSNLAGALREGGRTGSGGRSRNRVRNALACLQVALALVLLLGSALMLRSFLALRAVDPGFERPAEVLTFRLSVPRADVPDDDEAVDVQRRIAERLAAVPGVTRVGLASGFAMERRSQGNELYVEGGIGEQEFEPSVHYKAIGEGYFEAMEIPLLAGRLMSWEDIADRRPVGLITENLALRHFGDPAAAIGKRIRHQPDDSWREVIGVVGDVRDAGLRADAPGVVYWPMAVDDFLGFESWVRRDMAYLVRTTVTPATALLPQLREAVWSIDPDLPLASVQTMHEVVRRELASTEFMMLLLGIAATVAVLLGAVGVYGVISYAVSQRTREIGIRIALGATAADVKRLGLKHGLVIAAAGGTLGLLAALGLSRTLSSLLFGVQPQDPLSLTLIAALVTGVVLAASYIPARRATRIEPTEALRWE